MMFEVVSAETKLDAFRSSDPDVVGSGGRVLWMPTSGLIENEIVSTGSVFFYHRVLGVTFAVKALVPDGTSLSLADNEDRGRADFREVRFESPTLQVRSKQSVLPSDALVCEYEFINSGSDPVDVTVELILQNDFDDSSASVRGFEARDDALEIDKYLGVKDEPTLRVRGVATLSHRDDEGALVTTVTGSELTPTAPEHTAPEHTRGIIRRTLTLASGAHDSVRASFALTESMVQSRVAARLATTSNSVTGAT
ncbi:MAG: hypothetical protein ACR2PZ_03400, partial [Pseudomonadales bacterium]